MQGSSSIEVWDRNDGSVGMAELIGVYFLPVHLLAEPRPPKPNLIYRLIHLIPTTELIRQRTGLPHILRLMFRQILQNRDCQILFV